MRERFREAKEYNVVDPFEDRISTMREKDGDEGISNTAKETSRGRGTEGNTMIQVKEAVMLNDKVSLVFGMDGNVAIRRINIKNRSLRERMSLSNKKETLSKGTPLAREETGVDLCIDRHYAGVRTWEGKILNDAEVNPVSLGDDPERGRTKITNERLEMRCREGA